MLLVPYFGDSVLKYLREAVPPLRGVSLVIGKHISLVLLNCGNCTDLEMILILREFMLNIHSMLIASSHHTYVLMFSLGRSY